MVIEVKPIYTLNARGNVMLEVTRDYFKLSSGQMFQMIQSMRRDIEEVLAVKGIKYDDLKTALIPDHKRREIALVFDTISIENNWYGLEVFERIIPLLEKKSNHSILAGDYSGSNKHQEALHKAMSEAVVLKRSVDWQHSSQFYIVYINNLTDSMIQKIDQGLEGFSAYIGYADTTYSSLFKHYLSTMLVNIFLKHRSVIIQGHEDDRSNTEDINMCGYPFERYGYTCRSIQSQLEGTLLSFKIERPVFKGFEVDTEFALNSVTQKPSSLSDFSIDVDEAKLAYLKANKSGSLQRANLEEISSSELSGLITSKISDSYIYNMSYNAEHDTTKFNVMIEVPSVNESKNTRLLASLEYKVEQKALRLITLY